MAGILAFGYLPLFASAISLVIMSFMFLFIYKLKLKQNAMGITFVVGLFFLMGLQTMDRGLNNFQLKTLDTHYYKGKIYSAEVLSISSSKKLWNRALIRVNGLTNNYWRIPVDEKVLVFVRKDLNDIAVGDQIFCNAHITPIENKNNPGEFNSENYWQAKGVRNMAFLADGAYRVYGNEQNVLSRWFSMLDRSLSKLFEDKLQPEAVGVAKAMILGDRDHLDTETLRSFGNSGAMHVLAVSGLHVGLILAMLIFFLSKFPKRISKYQAVVISVVIIWLYAFLTGLSPSVFRAVVMFSMLSLAKLSGRQYSPLNVLGASAVVLLMYDRLLIFDLGFQLSYLAMLGIFVAYPMIKNLFFSRIWVVQKLWEGTSIALAAQLFTFPLTLYCFHQFPNYFLLSNIGLMVITNVILVSGVLFIILHKIPWLNLLLVWVLSFSVMSMFYFVQWIDFLPGSVAKGFVLSPLEVVLLYAFLLLLFFVFQMTWKYRTMVAGSIALLVCGLLVFQRFQQNNRDEFVVFNDSRIFFTLKRKDKLFCFYESDDYIGKVMYLAQSYERTRESNIQYVKLENNKETIIKGNGLDFRCQHFEKYYEIDLNGKRMHLTRQWSPEDEKKPKDFEVYMPWMMVKNDKAHKLKSGAFVYPI